MKNFKLFRDWCNQNQGILSLLGILIPILIAFYTINYIIINNWISSFLNVSLDFLTNLLGHKISISDLIVGVLTYLILKKIISNLFRQRITIIQGKYYSPKDPTKFVDVTNELVEMVNTHNQLHFKVGNQLIGGQDFHHGVVKKLDIEYQYRNNIYKKIVDEHEWVNLP